MPRQISVRAVDASEFFGCCVACGVQVTFAHPVAQGVEKIVADGRSALAQRTDLRVERRRFKMKIKVGIIGCGFVGGALKTWIEEINSVRAHLTWSHI